MAAAAIPSGALRRCGGNAVPKTRRSPLFYLRQVRPSDGPALIRMHERCSRATRYSRWLAPSSVFPDAYLRSMSACGPEHIAIVAVCSGRPSRIVGLASAAADSGGERELGFLIEDDYQGLGIGRVMLNALMNLIGPDEGLHVSVLFENQWLIGKLARFGTVVTQLDNGIIDARVTRTPRRPRDP
ncbi:GNAT family N-acetyltransferase [Mycobacterium florentinum]|nr:GNAT family N-acetyltransferase [Mycobacterium florentinum]MCV7412099.1 GNAT family N-acetyltransferase [Mycobacterium florentinum]